MFDNVPRAQFEAEQLLRIAAEQRVDSLTLVVTNLTNQLESMGKLLTRQAELHHSAQIDMLDRFEPKPSTLRLPAETTLRTMTAAEIRSQPAATRQEMLKRERLAQDADKREKEEAQQKSVSHAAASVDRASLAAAEQVRLSTIIHEVTHPGTN